MERKQMTQKERIVKYCRDFGSITSMEAYMDLGVTQLGARIKELEESGVLFKRTWKKSTNRYGEPVQFIAYSPMKKGRKNG